MKKNLERERRAYHSMEKVMKMTAKKKRRSKIIREKVMVFLDCKCAMQGTEFCTISSGTTL